MPKQKQTSTSPTPWQIVRRTLGYFFPIAWRYRKRYFFFWIIQSICSICKPFVAILMTPLLIDELLGERDLRELITYTLILVLGEVLLSLGASQFGVHLEKYATLFEHYFTEEMSLLSMELDFQLTEDKNALDQIEKARTGMHWYSGGIHGLTTQFFGIITYVLQIIGVIVVIALNAPLLIPITVILLAINTYLQSKINAIDLRTFKELAHSNRVFGYVLFQLADFRFGKDIRLYGAENMMMDKSETTIQDMTHKWKKQSDDTLSINLGMNALNAARDIVTYFYLGFLAIRGSITIGIFSQLLTAGSTFYGAVQGVIVSVQEILKRSSYAYEYVKFMEYPPALHKGDREIPAKQTHTIEFRNVSFTYPGCEVPVLKDVSITLHEGEHLSVVGLNGAGKTTFIKLLCRLYDVDSGEILLDGIDIKEYDYESYLRQFAVVFQDFRLFAFSAAENIALQEHPDHESLREIVKMAGLEKKISEMPNDLDTMLFRQFDKEGIEPSGGEQQKIAIARALYKNAPVVILDEPTAALDPVAEYEIYRQFNQLVGGKTAVYISHRLSSCKFCDRIAVFSEGTIKELGTHEELVHLNKGIYAEMFAAQSQYYQSVE